MSMRCTRDLAHALFVASAKHLKNFPPQADDPNASHSIECDSSLGMALSCIYFLKDFNGRADADYQAQLMC